MQSGNSHGSIFNGILPPALYFCAVFKLWWSHLACLTGFISSTSLENRKIQGSVRQCDLDGRKIPLGAWWSVQASSILLLTGNLAFKVPLGVKVWVRGEYISEPGPIVINTTGGLIYSLFIRYYHNANEGVFIVWAEENGTECSTIDA